MINRFIKWVKKVKRDWCVYTNSTDPNDTYWKGRIYDEKNNN